MTGEALTTQRSATPEVLLQVRQAHLHRRQVALIKKVEERATFHAENGSSLALGQAPLLEPTQHRSRQYFTPKVLHLVPKEERRLFRQFHCYL